MLEVPLLFFKSLLKYSNVWCTLFVVMGISSPFLVIFLPTTLRSFTKMRFRRSFWVAQHIWIIIISKLRQKTQNVSYPFFCSFVKLRNSVHQTLGVWWLGKKQMFDCLKFEILDEMAKFYKILFAGTSKCGCFWA